jgi:sulfur-carrier protein
MKYRIKTFGIARDIMGSKELILEISGNRVIDLRKDLSRQFPKLESLNSLFIAINQNYAEDETVINEADEIALIPPVSGG